MSDPCPSCKSMSVERIDFHHPCANCGYRWGSDRFAALETAHAKIEKRVGDSEGVTMGMMERIGALGDAHAKAQDIRADLADLEAHRVRNLLLSAAEKAIQQKRIERLERTVVELSEALVQAVNWFLPRPNELADSLQQRLAAIRADLADLDREREGR